MRLRPAGARRAKARRCSFEGFRVKDRSPKGRDAAYAAARRGTRESLARARARATPKGATLRFRPDRIVVGEVRDGAALEVLKAWNTGHPGGLLTVHANSAADAIARLEDLALEAVLSPPRRLLESVIDLVVFLARTPHGRRIEELQKCR